MKPKKKKLKPGSLALGDDAVGNSPGNISASRARRSISTPIMILNDGYNGYGFPYLRIEVVLLNRPCLLEVSVLGNMNKSRRSYSPLDQAKSAVTGILHIGLEDVQ